MKKVVFLSTIVLGATILVSSSQALADEVVNSKGETPTTIKIKDYNDGKDDDLDPKNPDQKQLVLKSVPGSYDFSTTLQDEDYTIEASLTAQNITVFNNRIDRDWSVKAVVTDNKITRGTDSFDVKSFKVNDTEIAETGASGIVAKAEATKTEQSNTGNIDTAIKNVSIKFSDAENIIKAGDSLAGTVTYQLYNSIDAK